ncbi:hypothetical protein HanPI659440_Chr12g0445251 [Helianthus annuus]|nr:hypothetical protein HanPI659440_Chr12g0445251 [Helianthus annuus]
MVIYDSPFITANSRWPSRLLELAPVVTLTTIAVTLPNVINVERESLMKSVREGFEYMTLVEGNLNATKDYAISQKASETLWQEVDVCRKWLGGELDNTASQVNIAASQVDPTLQIVQLFLKKSKNKINGRVRSKNDDSKFTSCCANSMYHITETIINDKESHERLFDELLSRIADIMAACLTNLPQVIAMKCHTSVIEKREACVEAAVRLFGATKEIINTLQDYDVPSMNPAELPFIDKWRVYLSNP